MGNSKFKRSFFFWVDKLQISKQERISIMVLFGLITVLLIANIFIKKRIVPAPENHDKLLAEFERRSALIKKEESEILEKYNPAEISKSTKTESAEKVVSDEEKISLNEASVEELEMLPGIGNTYAQRIIEYRKTNGDFKSVEDLVNVRGIGDKTLEKLKPYIKL